MRQANPALLSLLVLLTVNNNVQCASKKKFAFCAGIAGVAFLVCDALYSAKRKFSKTPRKSEVSRSRMAFLHIFSKKYLEEVSLGNKARRLFWWFSFCSAFSGLICSALIRDKAKDDKPQEERDQENKKEPVQSFTRRDQDPKQPLPSKSLKTASTQEQKTTKKFKHFAC